MCGDGRLTCPPSEARLVFVAAYFCSGRYVCLGQFLGRCHPERSEGPMHFACSITNAEKFIGPSARKERRPQDDKL